MHSLEPDHAAMGKPPKSGNGKPGPGRHPLKLRRWREHRGYSQEALAAKLGWTQGAISHLENNRSDYTGDTIAALAHALDCTPRDLMFRNPDDNEDLAEILETLPDGERRRALEIMKTFRETTN